MDLTSPELEEITDAIGVLQADKDRGREQLLRLWERQSPGGTPMQLCVLAHFLADTEADAASELEWDLRALEAATGSRGAEDRETLSPAMTSFLPSLHTSVGFGYLRLRDLERAGRHALIASERVQVLADDDYGRLIRGGLRRLQASLGTLGNTARPA